MVKVLPEPVTPSSTWVRSWRLMPSTSSLIAVGWSPFGSYSDLITKRHAAFGFLRARRAVRRPDLAWPSSPLNSGRPSRIRFSSASAVALTPSASILLRGGRASAASSSSSVGEAELPCEFGIERRDGRRGAVIGLRGFVEAVVRSVADSGGGGKASRLANIVAGCRASTRARDARRPRRRRGGPTNCPAAAAARCPSPCRHRRG